VTSTIAVEAGRRAAPIASTAEEPTVASSLAERADAIAKTLAQAERAQARSRR